jgi:hypothetical protein
MEEFCEDVEAVFSAYSYVLHRKAAEYSVYEPVRMTDGTDYWFITDRSSSMGSRDGKARNQVDVSG